MTDITPPPVRAPMNPLLSDAWYLRLEYLGRIVLPALATLYLALSSLWNFPRGPEVVGTIVAIDTFLGLFLGYAQKTYDNSGLKESGYDGSMDIVQTADGVRTFTLNLNGDPEALMSQNKVVFKVNPPPSV